MDIVTIDFETYYDKDYSLSKLTTEEYVRSEQFEIIGVGIKVNDDPVETFTGDFESTRQFVRSLDYSDKAILCHNTAFDGAILSWKMGIRPKLWLDTLSMARPEYKVTVGGSLAALTKYFRLGEKGTEVVQALGKHRLAFSPQELAAYMDYCANDVELTYQLFKKLRKGFPVQEIMVIDQTIRMYTEPRIILDRSLLKIHLKQVRERKQELIKALPFEGDEADIKSVLMSNDKFAKLLALFDVDPPMKKSPTTGNAAYAFAKTDQGLLDLLEHPDDRVQALVAARLGNKSTIEETRTERLIQTAERGPLPILLNFYGAHCVPGDTEVLTRCGWVPLNSWPGGDIAQWREDNSIEFLPASRYVGPEVDQWVESTARYMPVHMTLGHTVPTYMHGSKAFKTIKAFELVPKGSTYVPNAGVLTDEEHQLTSIQTRVIVMVQADGSYETNTSYGRKLTIFVKKPRKIVRARELLTEAGIPFSEQTYPSTPDYVRFIVKHRDLPEWLDGRYKFFGPWVLSTHKKAFMDEIYKWDGWAQGGQYLYSTSVKSNADWVQTVAHLSGFGCSIHIKKQRGNRETNYVAAFRARSECMVKRNQVKVVHDRKQAYCAETQTGFWLAKANGHIFITGNTGRFSGGDKLNLQNFPSRNDNTLRRTLCAPKGHVLVAVDSSQIEARMCAYIAQEERLLDSFRNGRDVYSEFATDAYGYPVTKAQKKERFVGKTCILGLQYGVGGPKLQQTLKLGQGGMKVELAINEAYDLISLYRNKYTQIPLLWRKCEVALQSIINHRSGQLHPNLLYYDEHGFEFPNGLRFQYPALEFGAGGFTYVADSRNYRKVVKNKFTNNEDITRTHLYGAKVVENLTQALARIVITEQMVRIGQQYPVAFQVHDEIIAVVPENEADHALTWMLKEMSVPPKWAPDLPVACEGGYGYNYGEIEK
jgi:hypothetical protein